MPNRLARALSPYLRAHAEDPVDWYPWGEEAFKRAREEDKPVFLSIGYSSCHWCHVMQRESFQDPEVAALLNAHFVPVKVDREERPDVDAAYMRALVSLTGQGGWPLSLFLTPEGKPFFGGTYFPKEDRWGRPGFLTVLRAVAQAWAKDPEALRREGDALAVSLARSLNPPPLPWPEDLKGRALARLEAQFDPDWGGFGPGPKFPQGPLLLYLLARAWKGEEAPKGMLYRTLKAMALGGVYDQVGGGFHRYAVDRRWRLPHFEKMLYDNALLARVYLGAYWVFGDGLFLRVARETLGFLLSLQDRSGGFYTALDAESGGEEGLYYTWTEEELREVLGEDFPRARAYFALGEDLGERSVLTAWGEEGLRKELGEGFEPWRKGVLECLLKARKRRLPPALDGKILADQTALAVRALAEAGRLLGEARYLEAAERGARFLLTQRQEGLIPHVWYRGERGQEAFLSDQAFTALALLELYGATGSWAYLEAARGLAEAAWEAFKGERLEETFAPLPFPGREIEEGAQPSGASALAEAFWRLGAAFGGPYRERAREVLAERGLWLGRYPEALPGFLLLHLLLEEGTELVLPYPTPFLREVQGLYLPLTQPVLGPAESLPGLEGKVPGRAYLCREGVCWSPLEEVGGLEAWVRRMYSSDIFHD